MKRNNWFLYLLITISFGAVIILFIALYTSHRDGVIIPIFIVDIIFLLASFFYFRMIYSGITKKNVGVIKEALESIAADPTLETPRIVSDDKDIVYFYEELDKITTKMRKNDESRQEILTIVNSVAINMDFDKLLDDLIPKLLDITNSTCCAFYMANPANNKLELKNSVGFSKNIYSEFDMNIGEGFIGVAASKRQTVVYNDIPDDTIYLTRTFLGKMKPKSLMVVPIINQEQIAGVLVFASLYDYTAEQLSMVETVKYYVGIALNNGITYERTKRLTNELKFQNKLIQNLNEELEKNVQERTLLLNNIMDSIKDYAIYSMDKNGRVLLWNKGAEILIGHKQEDVIGKPIESIYSAESGEAGMVAARIENTLRNGRYLENGWRNKQDGTKYYYEMEMFAMYNERGDIIGVTNVTRDMTELKNTKASDV